MTNSPNSKATKLRVAFATFFVILILVALLPKNAISQSLLWIRCTASPNDICYTNGNVGIGTMNPGVSLDVAGRGKFTDRLILAGEVQGDVVLEVTGSGIQELYLSNSTLYDVNQVRINDPGDTTQGEGIVWDETAAKIFVSPLNGGNEDGYLRLINDGGIVFEPGTQNIEAMTLNANGNLGLGTTNPNSKIQVTDGYVQLDTSTGMPSVSDCNSADEIGRMKVDSSRPYLYVCMAQGWARK